VIWCLGALENDIGNEGASRLAQALMINKSLEKVYLWWNPIGDEGAQDMVRVLEKTVNIRRIGLSCT